MNTTQTQLVDQAAKAYQEASDRVTAIDDRLAATKRAIDDYQGQIATVRAGAAAAALEAPDQQKQVKATARQLAALRDELAINEDLYTSLAGERKHATLALYRADIEHSRAKREAVELRLAAHDARGRELLAALEQHEGAPYMRAPIGLGRRSRADLLMHQIQTLDGRIEMYIDRADRLAAELGELPAQAEPGEAEPALPIPLQI